MKTLEQIDTEVKAQADAEGRTWFECIGSENNPLRADVTELIAFRHSVLAGNKYNQLYDIVSLLDSYLQTPSTDGRTERQQMRNSLREMIDKL
jgi:hypothetical protein